MRRALLAVVGTVAGLVLLLSFKSQPLGHAGSVAALSTHLNEPAPAPPAGAAPAPTDAAPTATTATTAAPAPPPATSAAPAPTAARSTAPAPAPAPATHRAAPAATAPPATRAPAPAATTPPKAAPKPAPTRAPVAPARRTLTGATADTPYGPVQLQVTITGGRLTAITILQVPYSSRRDQEIANYAVPVLNQEALAAQSANIDAVSGATYTSDGYIRSLQSALDQAGL